MISTEAALSKLREHLQPPVVHRFGYDLGPFMALQWCQAEDCWCGGPPEPALD